MRAIFSARKHGKMNGSHDEPAAEAARNNNNNDDDEAVFCGLHFNANCQSCIKWDLNGEGAEGADHEDEDENDAD